MTYSWASHFDKVSLLLCQNCRFFIIGKFLGQWHFFRYSLYVIKMIFEFGKKITLETFLLCSHADLMTFCNNSSSSDVSSESEPWFPVSLVTAATSIWRLYLMTCHVNLKISIVKISIAAVWPTFMKCNQVKINRPTWGSNPRPWD